MARSPLGLDATLMIVFDVSSFPQKKTAPQGESRSDGSDALDRSNKKIHAANEFFAPACRHEPKEARTSHFHKADYDLDGSGETDKSLRNLRPKGERRGVLVSDGSWRIDDGDGGVRRLAVAVCSGVRTERTARGDGVVCSPSFGGAAALRSGGVLFSDGIGDGGCVEGSSLCAPITRGIGAVGGGIRGVGCVVLKRRILDEGEVVLVGCVVFVFVVL